MTDLFEDLMRETDPARGLTPLDSARRTAILDAAVTTSAVIETSSRSRSWLRGVAAAAAVLALTGGALALQATSGHAPRASAQDVLQRAALAASDPVARPDQYWKITVTGTSVSGVVSDGVLSSALLRGTSTLYVAVDGTRPSWSVTEKRQVEAWLEGPPKPELLDLQPPRVYTTDLASVAIRGSWQQPNPAWLATLPRDPAALKTRLYQDSAQQGLSSDEEAYV